MKASQNATMKTSARPTATRRPKQAKQAKLARTIHGRRLATAHRPDHSRTLLCIEAGEVSGGLAPEQAYEPAEQCAGHHGDDDGEDPTARHNGHHDAQAAIKTA